MREASLGVTGRTLLAPETALSLRALRALGTYDAKYSSATRLLQNTPITRVLYRKVSAVWVFCEGTPFRIEVSPPVLPQGPLAGRMASRSTTPAGRRV